MDHKYKICAFYVIKQLEDIQKSNNADILLRDFLRQCIYNVGIDSIATWNEEKPPEPNLVVKKKERKAQKKWVTKTFQCSSQRTCAG